MFAPLLVRLMRIHRIFNSMKAMEGEWSDRVLFLWTILLVSVHHMKHIDHLRILEI